MTEFATPAASAPHALWRWFAPLLLALVLPLAAAAQDGLAARRGVLALPGGPGELVELKGEWGFAWRQFADPQAALAPARFAMVPSSWAEMVIDGRTAGSDGYATYSLRVDCPAGSELALAVPAQRTALRLFVNGKLAATQGDPGASPDTALAAIGPRAVVTSPFACPLQVVAHVSNYSHRAGGLVRAPTAGPVALVLADVKERLVLNTVLLGAFLVLGLVPLMFWLARRKDVTPLMFGLFCLAIGTYSDMTGERLLLLPFGGAVAWEHYLRIEYLAWFASMASFLVLVRQLFTREMPRRLHYALAAACCACLLAVVVTPARIYSWLAPAGQVLTIAIALLVTFAVVQAVRHGRSGARVLLGGMGFLLLVIVLDALRYNLGGAARSITPFGTLVFSLAPALVLARRLARALNVEELRGLEQRVTGDLLVRTTKAGIYDWDTIANRVAYSDRLKEMLGYPSDTDTSKWPLFYEFIHPEDRDAVRSRFMQQLRECKVASGEMRHVPFEYRLVRRDGTPVWVRAEAIGITGSDCLTLRYICSFIDISEQRALQDGLTASRDEVAAQAEQLKRQNAALEDNARLREDVERMSRHDLKTPLNSIIGATRLLRDDTSIDGERRELLGIIERAGHRMLEMVNLSLGLFKMEMGNYDFHPQAVQMQDIANRVLRDLRTHAESCRVALRFRTDAYEPVYARAEELLCYTIVANLVKNALEATPPGGFVTLSLKSGQPTYLHVHNPQRVPPMVAARFFEKYVTGGKSGGTGLGTYSARMMARAQEGDLTMVTGEEGTTLTLMLKAVAPDSLPVAAPRSDVSRRIGPPVFTFPQRHVLVVDDDEYTRLIVRRFLPAPLTVETAANGQAATEAALRHWPDFVVIDMEMPVMDGPQAIAWLRQREAAEARPRIRIVMVSSNDDAVSVNKGLAAGADRYLVKPVTKEALLATLQELDTELPATPVTPAPAPIRTRPAPEALPDAVVEVDPDLESQIPEFLRSRRELADGMADALAADDREKLRGLAHRAAGGLALYGFQWAAWQSREIETQALEGEADGLQRGIAALIGHLREVRVRAGRAAE